jgi:hypothetical protein
VKYLEDVFPMMVFFEHLCFVVIGFMGMKGRKPKSLLDLGSILGS